MRLIQLAALLLLSVTSIKMTESCEIASNTPTAHGRVIDVTCEPGMNFSLEMEDGDELSTLEVFGKTMGEEFDKFLKAERYGKSSNMSFTLLAKRLDDKDENPGDQSAALNDLLENPYFASFPAVARLIHDELQLPGWESSSVMMLYHIGMSLDDHQSSRKRRQVLDDEDRRRISELQQEYSEYYVLDNYHGPNPRFPCPKDGRIESSFSKWKRNDCFGMCGRLCSCWLLVCGDCCIHPGCKRHDQFCKDRGFPACLITSSAYKHLTLDVHGSTFSASGSIDIDC